MKYGITLAACLVTSFVLTGLWRVVLVRHSVLDHANSRSSHSGSIPRGGGVAFCLLTLLYAGVSLALDWSEPRTTMILLVGGGLVAIVGFIDDLKPLPAGVRLLAHAVAAAVLVVGLSPLPDSIAGVPLAFPPLLIQALLAIAVIWSINLWNFMDGIDGLAGSQAVITLAGITIVSSCTGVDGILPAVIAGLVAGFLVWNLSSTRLFMGDAGSGFLGFVVVLMIAALWSHSETPIWSGVLVTAMMWIDATVTLIRRTLRGQRPWVAHRSHAYQHLAHRGWTHRRVTAAYGGIQIAFLCPLAIAAMHWTWAGPWLTIAAIAILTPIAMAIGAGVDEPKTAR